jgi:hypothetical protein
MRRTALALGTLLLTTAPNVEATETPETKIEQIQENGAGNPFVGLAAGGLVYLSVIIGSGIAYARWPERMKQIEQSTGYKVRRFLELMNYGSVLK